MSSKSNKSLTTSGKILTAAKSPSSSSKSPRARAHALTTSSKKRGKRSRSQKKIRRSYDSSDMDSVTSSYTNGSSKANNLRSNGEQVFSPVRPPAQQSPNRGFSSKGSGSLKSLSTQPAEMQNSINVLQMQLAEVLEENQFLKTRLSVELKEKHLLEAKNRELNKNLSESKKVLQETGAALMQVHRQTNELKSKRDEREIQLNDAMFDNKELQRRISELEREIQTIQKSADSSATVATFQRMLADKETLIRSIEEEQGKLQSLLFKAKKDCDRVAEEKDDFQTECEKHKRKISKLEKTIAELHEELLGAEKLLGSPRNNHLLSGFTSINGSFAVPDRYPERYSDSPQRVGSSATFATTSAATAATTSGEGSVDNISSDIGSMAKAIEGLVQSVEGRSKTMEERMALMESQLSTSILRLNSQEDISRRLSAEATAAKPTAVTASAHTIAPAPVVTASVATAPVVTAPVVTAPVAAAAAIETVVITKQPEFFEVKKEERKKPEAPVIEKPAVPPSITNNTNINTSIDADADAEDALFSASSVVEISDVLHRDLDSSKPPSADHHINSKPTHQSTSSEVKAPVTAENTNTSSSAAVAANSEHTASVSTTNAQSSEQQPPPQQQEQRSNSSIETGSERRERGVKRASIGATALVRSRNSTAESAARPQVAAANTAQESATTSASKPQQPVASTVDTTATAAAAPTEVASASSASAASAQPATGSESESSAKLAAAPPLDMAVSSPPPTTAERVVARYRPTSAAPPVVLPSSPQQRDESSDEYIARLTREKKRFKRDIFTWTKDFAAKNARQPTREDREKFAAPIFKAYKGNAKLLKEAGVVGGVGESTKAGSMDMDD